MEVITAQSGEEGIDLLASTPIDLLISDVRMPGMSGEEVVQAVHEAHPELPVVLITGKGDIKSAVNAMKLGAFDYVIKPPEESELRLITERALEHSKLQRENKFLRAELSAGGMYGERLIGRSPKMLEVFDIINRVASTDSTVLITGETGTGKELAAQTIHYKSRRANHPLVALNCASLNPNLIESELFGHEKGAFTSAATTRRGRFEDADGGTLFLDEITETNIEFQAKLLRVLQEGEFERLGGNKKISVDVRLLVSTNKNLEQEVKSGNFREDLFYRLKVIPIHLPSLKERREDIKLLAAHFAETYSKRYRDKACTIAVDGLDYLTALEWKGNVRELQHTIERAVVLSQNDSLKPNDFISFNTEEKANQTDQTLNSIIEEKTREHLIETLNRTGWHKKQTANILGIDRVTLYRMLKKYSIEK
ncbi:sigma-54-dependent transcriptional regulator, partial [Verrucomicrobiota bacterium]